MVFLAFCGTQDSVILDDDPVIFSFQATGMEYILALNTAVVSKVFLFTTFKHYL